MASFTAAGTAYATWGQPLVPFFIFYSMFGFQRVGDLIWAFGDMRGRGFLCGATAGRTTLNGEGLQHEDGHSLILGSTVPNLCAYDPSFAYETAVIVKDGIRRMYGEVPEDRFYYLTLYNENHQMPARPEGVTDEDITGGVYRFLEAPEGPSRSATLLFSGSANRAVLEARTLLAEEFDVAASAWSVTSYKGLREDALAAERWSRLHPGEPARTSLLADRLGSSAGPIVAVTDFMKALPDQVGRFLASRGFVPLGTDGYGRSDTRTALRRHFEVDAAHIVVATLAALVEAGEAKAQEVAQAIETFGIDPDAVNPLHA
jgi:pyruvate dehydrogenase E1 component